MTPTEICEAIPVENRRLRHTLFARYVLGEDWLTALLIGRENAAEPIDVADMEHIARRWEAANAD